MDEFLFRKVDPDEDEPAAAWFIFLPWRPEGFWCKQRLLIR
jgi:hypothetical protein